MSKLTDLFEHMQRYTRDVFSDRMRKEGFSSYKGQDVHWYRLVNNEVVQAVYFVAFHAAPCTFAEIKYGCHPLFIPPIFQKSPLMKGWPDYLQASELVPDITPDNEPYGIKNLLLYNLNNNRPYRVPDALIMCSPDQNDGLDVLEKLLPVLDENTTTVACYELHKEIRRRVFESEISKASIMSTFFIDEALYLEDKEIYPYCREYVKDRAWKLEANLQSGGIVPNIFKQDWERSSVLNQVFEDDAIENYLNTFEDRAKKTLRLLERNTGIKP